MTGTVVMLDGSPRMTEVMAGDTAAPALVRWV
jgi:hypothetical protein